VIEVLREAGIRKAGFEDEAMTVGEHRRLTGAGVDFEGIGALCERIRVVKDAEEIDAMRRAARLTDEGFEYILPFVRPGAAEFEIRAEMDYFFAAGRDAGLPDDCGFWTQRIDAHAIPESGRSRPATWSRWISGQRGRVCVGHDPYGGRRAA
jgi:Xaa-Pro aminopeptidase